MSTRRIKVTTRGDASPKDQERQVEAGRAAKPRRAAASAQRDTLNVRIKREDRALIDRAANLSGKSRTEFLLEAARRAATDTVLERSLFLTDTATFLAFAERLDAPPDPNDRLRRMLREPAPWDR